MQLHLSGLALVLWAAPLIGKAQEGGDEQRWNGLRGGYDLSDLVGGSVDVDVRPGFYGGFYRNIVKVPIYSLSLGLEFNTAGAIGEHAEQRLSYISLPINNRVKLGLFYIDGGADVGYKLTEKWVVDGNSMAIPDDAKADPWNVMAHVGAGVKVLFLGIDARYQYGLTEVYPGIRNTNIQLGLSTFF